MQEINQKNVEIYYYHFWPEKALKLTSNLFRHPVVVMHDISFSGIYEFNHGYM